MKALIWKEWRERRWWALIAVVATVVSVVTSGGYTFIGDASAFSIWLWIAIAAAAMLGFGAFTSEIGKGTADFLRSRPVDWKQALAAKLVIGFSAVIAASAVAVVVYALTMPEEYAQFGTTSSLASGFVFSLLILDSAFLMGLSFSVVLPGVLGGALTFLSVLILMTLVYEPLSIATGKTVMSAWPLIYWLIGALVAMLVISRFGLTLPPVRRAWRYGLIVFLIGASSTGYVVAKHGTRSPYELLEKTYLNAIPNSDASYVFRYRSRADGNKVLVEGCLVRVSDGKQVNFHMSSTPMDDFVFWIDNRTVVFFDSGALNAVQMDNDGNLRWKSTRKLTRNNFAVPIASPDLKHAIVRDGKHKWLIDIQSMEAKTMDVPEQSSCWWHSNTEITCRDEKDNVRILTVKEIMNR